MTQSNYYFDNNATTNIPSEILDEMMPFFRIFMEIQVQFIRWAYDVKNRLKKHVIKSLINS